MNDQKIIQILNKLKNRISFEPVTARGDISQKKVLRFLEEEISLLEACPHCKQIECAAECIDDDDNRFVYTGPRPTKYA